ncbi:ABC-2 family transporter protein [Gemmata sp. SH-PL17]|uniref:ABC transporter permease n=1 Tax=Gemmata sp. SH-PL17 TaxID=1630693 RepID=UPI00078C812D|nr:ABC transporter permease subunit [Gemmata sp. SH-PL17]AMV25739.1 ABC-2 family transporter protein [Gemmata sp. SH-PL17]
MAQTDTLLRYRPWRGTPRGPLFASTALARASLKLLLRRRLMWGLFALALLVFFFFFYAQYLVVWIANQLATETVRFAGIPVNARNITRFLDRLALNGTDHTFGNFIWYQGYVLVIVLALAGSVLVGNDFSHGSLPFYLSKPIGRWHYVLGKCLAIGALINLLTTVPAVVLWLEAGLLYDWKSYYLENFTLLLGIIGYGFALTITLSPLTVATAVLVRRTVPMAMIWMGLFVLLPMLSGWLVETLKDEHWRLIDLWNDLYLCGLSCLSADPASIRPQPQPEYWQAWIATGAVVVACVLYLRRRIQAVEIVQ